jgi:hypothetical protein
MIVNNRDSSSKWDDKLIKMFLFACKFLKKGINILKNCFLFLWNDITYFYEKFQWEWFNNSRQNSKKSIANN